MHHDQPFRTILIAICVLVFPFALYFRLKSMATREKLSRKGEGPFILATLRPVGISLWLGLLAWMVRPEFMAWSSVSLPDWLRWTGVAVMVLACGLLLWTLRCLGANLTDTVVTRQRHTLVVNGPYRWIRHPFYDAALSFAVAISLIAANWFFLAGGIAMFSLFMIRARVEEDNLTIRFGDSYRTYRERTGKVFPRIG